jgi:hypothetical protein
MRRRRFLRGAGGVAGSILGVAGGASTRRVAAHPGPYEPYGSIDIEGTKEAVVGPDGEVAYLATTTGYATVDVSVPDRPGILADVRDPLADRDGGPLRVLFDLKLDVTDPTTLVVAGPANPRRGAISGILVVDVSDPARPVEVAFHATEFPVHNCFVRDGLAYLTGNDGGRNPLVIVDVETGAEVGRWSVADVTDAWAAVPSGLRSVHDVYVTGDTAFVALWDAGTWILDVSDPATPTAEGRVDAPDPDPLAALPESAVRRRATLPPGNHHYVATDESGTLLGVGRESWGLRVEDDATGGGDGRSRRRIRRRPLRDRPLGRVGSRSPGPAFDDPGARHARPDLRRRVDDRTQLRALGGRALRRVVPRRGHAPRRLGPGRARAAVVVARPRVDEFLDRTAGGAGRPGRLLRRQQHGCRRRPGRAVHVSGPRGPAGRPPERAAVRDRDAATAVRLHDGDGGGIDGDGNAGRGRRRRGQCPGVRRCRRRGRRCACGVAARPAGGTPNPGLRLSAIVT